MSARDVAGRLRGVGAGPGTGRLSVTMPPLHPRALRAGGRAVVTSVTAGCMLLVTAAPAQADNCSGLSDCSDSVKVGIAAAAALALGLLLAFGLPGLLASRALPEAAIDDAENDAFAVGDPQRFHGQWTGLLLVDKDSLYEEDPYIGNRPGMPWADKDHYNRLHLAELTESAQAKVNQLRELVDLAGVESISDPIGPPLSELRAREAQLAEAVEQLGGYKAVADALGVKDGAPRYLAMIDDHGHAAISIGDPDTAIRNAVFVPGTGQDLRTVGPNSQRAVDMLNATLNADPSLTLDDVSATVWLGYDRPMNLPQAASPEPAINGAQRLDLFVDGMHASHTGGPAINTVVAHSYGTTVTGAASTGGHHLAVDNVVALGSPGMRADHVGDLNLAQGAHVYAITARNDPIQRAVNLTLGTDPVGPSFGATRLAASPGPSSRWGFSEAAHSSYWDPGNPALANMGAVIAGQPQLVTPP